MTQEEHLQKWTEKQDLHPKQKKPTTSKDLCPKQQQKLTKSKDSCPKQAQKLKSVKNLQNQKTGRRV